MDLFESAGGTAAVATRVVTLTGITLAVGALAFRFLVAERLSDSTMRATHRELPSVAWVGLIGALLATLIAPIRLVVQAQALGDGSQSMLGAVASTAWGMAVIAQGIRPPARPRGFSWGASVRGARKRTAGRWPPSPRSAWR